MQQDQITSVSPNSTNAVLGAVYRLLFVVGAPFFMVYMLFPPLWLLGLPYWIITDRDLMTDWCKMYGV
jgi:hypothetical protein